MMRRFKSFKWIKNMVNEEQTINDNETEVLA